MQQPWEGTGEMRSFVIAGAMATLMSTAVDAKDLLPTQEARLICRALDRTGLTSAPCTYSGWNSTITMTIDMAASEARNLCQQLVAYSRQQRLNLPGWRLEIRSPYSANSSIAFCMLG